MQRVDLVQVEIQFQNIYAWLAQNSKPTVRGRPLPSCVLWPLAESGIRPKRVKCPDPDLKPMPSPDRSELACLGSPLAAFVRLRKHGRATLCSWGRGSNLAIEWGRNLPAQRRKAANESSPQL